MGINERTEMDRYKILICEESGARRNDLIRVLGNLDAEIASVAVFSQAVRALQDGGGFALLVASLGSLKEAPPAVVVRLKKEMPGLSVIALAKGGNTEAGLALLDKGVFDHLAEPGDLVGIYAAARSEKRKKELIAQNELYARSLRKLKAEL